MSAWQPLPDDLPPEVRHFVEQLRQLKDRTGLSLVSLGARTAYSKSSWQRYLNATQPPPRQAVIALCRVAEVEKEEAERFGVRWELAVGVWPKAVAGSGSGSGSGSGPSEAEAEVVGDEYEDDPTLPWWDAPPGKSGPSTGRLLVVAVALATVLAVAVVIGAVVLG
ncbi:helix-turn-helix domain-containing protein [Streptomyces lanatus]|uniref:Helix-turn-helix transcriptional regulator n=1 Tax=Streptomyces lanatus TaxID=66900 RepID=A0ABV1XUZ9_9ACTN|nr:helix-turn-helix transcriptional regulator [Streptomyces lanatus]GHH13154.1 hypothetical protein GCM10018780_52530 [Streptomyces lanatus]